MSYALPRSRLADGADAPSAGRRRSRAALIPALVLVLASCAVGPNFHPPARPTDTRYTAKALPAETVATGVPGGEAQRLQFGQQLPGQWWTLFGSNKLDALIERAMANYPDITAQQAALREARENVRAEAGVFLPQFQGTGYASRSETSGATYGPGFPNFISNIFQATVNVSYTFDIFGKARRTVEGLEAQAQYQNFQLEASYLTLSGNVASTAIQIAALNDEIAATHDIISIEQKQLKVIEERFRLGAQTRADILQQQSNVAAVRATLAPLQQQLAQAEHALAVLTGRTPQDATPLELTLSELKLPEELPVSLPSSLVEQRPDIRAGQAMLHSASAAIGVATANMLPQLTLSGQFGDENLKFANLINPASNIWNLAGNLTQPLFEGGTLRARRRAAVDAYEQAAAQYRLVVLQAFQNVADTLTALTHDAQALAAEHDALDAAQASLNLIQKQYAVGAVDYATLLAAQQSYQQARLGYLRAIASRYTDTVTLFQALGGGWWRRKDPGTLPVPR
jgi:NodT family efflux transporter outer membrane factor (OMF) lipoprotein